MNAPDIEIIDRFFADVVMPKLLGCGPELREWRAPLPTWWTLFVGGTLAEKRIHAPRILHEQSRHLHGLALRVDFLAALVVADLIDRELGYRELALIPLSDIGQLTHRAQEVVIGARHVIEDIDDNFEFGLGDEALERDLKLLQQEAATRYCE